jgi:hypothetical protein
MLFRKIAKGHNILNTVSNYEEHFSVFTYNKSLMDKYKHSWNWESMPLCNLGVLFMIHETRVPLFIILLIDFCFNGELETM